MPLCNSVTNKLGTIAPYAISYFKSVRKSRRTCFWLRPVKIMNVFHSVSLLGLDTNWASEEDNHVVARGEYDFTAASQEELSMRAGEMLNLAPKGDELFTSCRTFDSECLDPKPSIFVFLILEITDEGSSFVCACPMFTTISLVFRATAPCAWLAPGQRGR